MTKQEFIQEAALRILGSQFAYTMEEIAENATALADRLYGKEESKQEPEIMTGFPCDEPISAVIREVDRIDDEAKWKQTEDAKRKGWDWRYQKSGYAEKVRNVCNHVGINTVQDLIDFGRTKFLAQRNVGNKCCGALDKALENLYNIWEW